MDAFLDEFQRITGFTAGLSRALLLLAGALALGTAWRVCLLITRPSKDTLRKMRSMIVWWGMLGIFVICLMLGPWAITAVIAAACLVAWVEMTRLVGVAGDSRTLRVIIPVGIVIGVWWAALGEAIAFAFWLPLYLLCAAAAARMAARGADTFINSMARHTWAALACGFLLPHLLLLYTAPPLTNTTAGPAGWLVYVLALTELNDITQALWGKAVGGPKIAPTLSPKKTWAGFLGGILTTALAAALIGPWLTPWGTPLFEGSFDIGILCHLAAGAGIAITGYVGDLLMSAVKRDAGVKDSSDILPAQGGLLDRIDSLMLTAPMFYHALRWGLGDG